MRIVAFVLCLTVWTQALAEQAPGSLVGTVRLSNARPEGAVVYLAPEGGISAVPVNDSALIDQRDLQFEPRVLVVQLGAVVQFRNSDPLLHNVFSPPHPGPGFDLGTYPMHDARPHRFSQPGGHVILCHVHPEMLAYVVVVPTRHRAVVDDAGRFEIPDVAPGRYVLHVWHRRAAPFEQPVTIEAGVGRSVTLEIRPR